MYPPCMVGGRTSRLDQRISRIIRQLPGQDANLSKLVEELKRGDKVVTNEIAAPADRSLFGLRIGF